MSKKILITGTSTGFGKLMSLTLAKAGYTVIATMRGTNDKNKEVAIELAAQENIEVVEMDITSDESVQTAISQVLEKHQKIDVLVNNAGITGYGIIEGYSIAQVKKMFEVNFFGVLRTYDAILPSMRAAHDGLIINISTGASGFTVPYMVPYFSSKFAMESLVEGFDLELRPYGIENVSIQSGVYPTEMGKKEGASADKPEIVAEYGDKATIPFQKMGASLFGKMAEFNMNPQTIADGVLSLVEMEKGKRPLRLPLDAVALGTDQEFIDARATIKTKWAKAYGFDI